MISIAGFLLLFGGLISLLMLIAAPIVLALFIVGLALRLVFFVLFRLALPVLGLGLGALLLLGAIPLLPLILVAAGIYLVFKGMRRHPAPVSPSPGS